MSDFIESEAEESEEEFEEKDLKPKKTQRFMEDDGKIWIVWFWVCVSEVGVVWWCGPLICHLPTDEEEEDNTEDQDERGNLRGLIDDGDVEEEEEEEEEPEKNASPAGSDSEEEVRHRRKKRSKFIWCF